MLGHYINGNYRVYLKKDGSKIRFTLDDELRPERAESIDVTITEKCSVGCPFCYANCTPTGKHAELFRNDEPVIWLSSIKEYTELAINGNDMDHPQLLQFLEYCKDHRIIVNITLHQDQFVNNYHKLYLYQQNNLIHGIGISVTDVDKTLVKLIKSLKHTVCHVIAGIVDDYTLNKLANNDLSLLILGYKIKGRGEKFHNIRPKATYDLIDKLSSIIIEYSEKFKVISFDCLACEQLKMKDKMSEEEWNKFYMGADGTTTFFIDAVHHRFAKSSTETEYYDMKNLSVEHMFGQVISE